MRLSNKFLINIIKEKNFFFKSSFFLIYIKNDFLLNFFNSFFLENNFFLCKVKSSVFRSFFGKSSSLFPLLKGSTFFLFLNKYDNFNQKILFLKDFLNNKNYKLNLFILSFFFNYKLYSFSDLIHFYKNYSNFSYFDINVLLIFFLHRLFFFIIKFFFIFFKNNFLFFYFLKNANNKSIN